MAAGVTSIRIDMRTAHNTPLDMRLVLFRAGGSASAEDRWTSTDSVTLPNDGFWHELTFPLLESDLSQDCLLEARA